MREFEAGQQPSVDMGTSTNEFFDPFDYYPLQYSQEKVNSSVDWSALLNSP